LGKIWRPEPESNRRIRICSPLRHHSAIGPQALEMRGDSAPSGFVSRLQSDCFAIRTSNPRRGGDAGLAARRGRAMRAAAGGIAVLLLQYSIASVRAVPQRLNPG